MDNNIAVTVDFGGGLDLVFDGLKEIKLSLPKDATVQTVIAELAGKHANHKREMFAVNEKMYFFLTQTTRHLGAGQRRRLGVVREGADAARAQGQGELHFYAARRLSDFFYVRLALHLISLFKYGEVPSHQKTGFGVIR